MWDVASGFLSLILLRIHNFSTTSCILVSANFPTDLTLGLVPLLFNFQFTLLSLFLLEISGKPPVFHFKLGNTQIQIKHSVLGRLLLYESVPRSTIRRLSHGLWSKAAIFTVSSAARPAKDSLKRNLIGKRTCEKIDTCKCITESLYCTPETNRTLLNNYTAN